MAGVIGIVQTTRANRQPAASWTVTALLALAPLGMVIDGIFNLQAILPHTLGFVMATGSEVLSFLAAGLYFRRIPRWRRLGNRLLFASPLTLVLVVLFFSTFVPTAVGAQHGVAGLTQRILVIEVLGWFVAMGGGLPPFVTCSTTCCSCPTVSATPPSPRSPRHLLRQAGCLPQAVRSRQPLRLLSVMACRQWPWNGSWNGSREHRVHSGHRGHRNGLSVQAERSGRRAVLMVRRRSTVRFRKGAPRSLYFFEISSHPICRFRGTGRRDALLLTVLRLITPDGY